MKLTSYRIFQLIFGIIGLIILFILYKKSEKTKQELLDNKKYTIGITNGKTQGLRNVFPFVNYYFYVNNIKYASSVNISLKENPININGGRYLVVYSVNNPQNSEFLFTCQIPDSIQESPLNGWEESPINCNQKIFN